MVSPRKLFYKSLLCAKQEKTCNLPSYFLVGGEKEIFTKSVERRAIQGLAIYFAILIPFSALFETLMIRGNLAWVWALMWTPAAASMIARLALREGIADVSFSIGKRKIGKAILLALLFPLVIGLVSYGIAWMIGVVPFHPKPIELISPYVPSSTSPFVILLLNLIVAITVVTLFSIRTAAGEEIGWRGYMLTRLIDARIPMPILTSGLIWGIWHVPLILGGVYLEGPHPIIAAFLWVILATAFSFLFARLRLESGSVWPAIVLHASWNSIIQVALDPASTSPSSALWVGESGILVTLTTVIAAAIYSWNWKIR